MRRFPRGHTAESSDPAALEPGSLASTLLCHVFKSLEQRLASQLGLVKRLACSLAKETYYPIPPKDLGFT